MRRTVLLVEDEAPIADVVEMHLQQSGFDVRLAAHGDDARRALDDPAIDVVLLDLTLPDGDGIDLLKEIRDRRSLPVIMVTPRAEEADRVLRLGADDYVTKPLSPREVTARVRAVLRREELAATVNAGPVTFGDLRLDPRTREVTVSDRAIELTRMEFDVLAYLVTRPGRAFTRTQLLQAVWGYPSGIDTRTVDVHVAQLRRKLGGLCPVRTVRGVGYMAEPPPSSAESSNGGSRASG